MPTLVSACETKNFKAGETVPGTALRSGHTVGNPGIQQFYHVLSMYVYIYMVCVKVSTFKQPLETKTAVEGKKNIANENSQGKQLGLEKTIERKWRGSESVPCRLHVEDEPIMSSMLTPCCCCCGEDAGGCSCNAPVATEVMKEGDPGDAFFIIRSGEACDHRKSHHRKGTCCWRHCVLRNTGSLYVHLDVSLHTT